MDLSIIVPLLNEAESIPELFAWIGRVMKQNNFSYEVIFVDDGSTDDSWKISRVIGAAVIHKNHLITEVVLFHYAANPCKEFRN